MVVRCPHTVGLCFEVEMDGDDWLMQLPCPCNDRSEIIARVTPVDL